MTTEWALALTIMGRRHGSLLSPASGGLGGGMAQMKIIAGLPRVFAKQSGGKFRYVCSVFRTTIHQFFVFYAHFLQCITVKHQLNEAYVYFSALSFLSFESEYRTRNNERRRIKMFRHSKFLVQYSIFEFQISGFEFRISDFEFQVSNFEFGCCQRPRQEIWCNHTRFNLQPSVFSLSPCVVT